MPGFREDAALSTIRNKGNSSQTGYAAIPVVHIESQGSIRASDYALEV